MRDLLKRGAEPPVLRPYQEDAVRGVLSSFRAGNRAPVLVLTTGSGKTVISGPIIRNAVEASQTVLFLAPRRELVYQCSDALAVAGIDHGLLMAGEDDSEAAFAEVVVASFATLQSRLRQGRMPIRDPGLIVVDEAHLSITKRQVELLSRWPNARLLGLTATPSRRDGKALGVLFDDLIEPVTAAELTEQGYLVPAMYFSISEPDLSGVQTVAGDYNQGQLERAVNRSELVGDIVQTWLERAGDRRTAVFATSIAHAVNLAEQFQRAGVAAEHVDAGTSVDERSAIFDRFRRGETQVLTNCFLASYGFDLPVLSCVVLARPTQSLVLYLQMIGRGLRPADGKSDCLVLDHSGAVHRHGFAADARIWTLDGRTALKEPDSRTSSSTGIAARIDCPECAATFERTRVCPECGFELRPKGREVETIDGRLVEVHAGLEEDETDRRIFYGEVRGIGEERGYKPGWAAHKFRERFGEWPPFDWNSDLVLQPTLASRRWIKSRQIAWAKSQRRAS